MPIGSKSSVICVSTLVFLWLGINVADAFWLYFYVEAVVNPNPRTAVNRTASAFSGYEGMMMLFGIIWSVVNFCVTGVAFIFVTCGGDRAKGLWARRSLSMFGMLVLFPVFVFMSLMPFFGNWIVTPIVRSFYWNHRCDSYPMYAILDGKAFDDPLYVQNVVYFYETRTNRFLYTYVLTNPDDGDEWFFRLRSWAADQASIAQAEYPTLQSVGYDFASLALTGNCTLPQGNGTTTRACVAGTFDPGDHLAFNITSSVPLNTTTSLSSRPLSLSNTTTNLKIEDNAWTYPTASPALVLRTANATTGQLGPVVLRTTVRNPHDCTELKVCLAGVPEMEGMAGLVGAEVMVPMGIVLFGEAQHAIECTTSS